VGSLSVFGGGALRVFLCFVVVFVGFWVGLFVCFLGCGVFCWFCWLVSGWGFFGCSFGGGWVCFAFWVVWVRGVFVVFWCLFVLFGLFFFFFVCGGGGVFFWVFFWWFCFFLGGCVLLGGGFFVFFFVVFLGLVGVFCFCGGVLCGVGVWVGFFVVGGVWFFGVFLGLWGFGVFCWGGLFWWGFFLWWGCVFVFFGGCCGGFGVVGTLWFLCGGVFFFVFVVVCCLVGVGFVFVWRVGFSSFFGFGLFCGMCGEWGCSVFLLGFRWWRVCVWCGWFLVRGFLALSVFFCPPRFVVLFRFVVGFLGVFFFLVSGVLLCCWCGGLLVGVFSLRFGVGFFSCSFWVGWSLWLWGLGFWVEGVFFVVLWGGGFYGFCGGRGVFVGVGVVVPNVLLLGVLFGVGGGLFVGLVLFLVGVGLLVWFGAFSWFLGWVGFSLFGVCGVGVCWSFLLGGFLVGGFGFLGRFVFVGGVWC